MTQRLRHNIFVVYTRNWRRWWRKEFWTVCWTCNLHIGPFPTKHEALIDVDELDLEGEFGDGRPFCGKFTTNNS